MSPKLFRLNTNFNNLSIVLIFTSLIFTACKKETKQTSGAEAQTMGAARFENNGNGWGTVSPDMVLRWNDAAFYLMLNTPQPPPVTPFWSSRYTAMVHIAMHDALNSIVPKYKTYALNTRDKDASPDAAVAQAAYDVIVNAYNTLNPPIETPQFIKDHMNELLQQSLSAITDVDAKAKGVALGHAAAQAVIQKRTNDGTQNITYTLPEGTLPGQYRWTPPFNIPGLPVYGLVDAVGWQNVTPFGLTSASQFRPGPPYGKTDTRESIKTPQYIADYNEIKSMGCDNCGTRTADQTQFAKFWVESPNYGWNKIARNIIAQKNMDAWKVARLLALVQIAENDSYISSADAKFYYWFWRPITAINSNNMGATPGTIGDANWNVLVFPTPPAADYPSAHANAGGAGAEVIRQFFNQDNFSFSFASTSADPLHPIRSFTSLSQAARENSLSRMYVGYHFRESCLVGEQVGKYIGGYIATHSLQPN
jgi:hypothetical protein